MTEESDSVQVKPVFIHDRYYAGDLVAAWDMRTRRDIRLDKQKVERNGWIFAAIAMVGGFLGLVLFWVLNVWPLITGYPTLDSVIALVLGLAVFVGGMIARHQWITMYAKDADENANAFFASYEYVSEQLGIGQLSLTIPFAKKQELAEIALDAARSLIVTLHNAGFVGTEMQKDATRRFTRLREAFLAFSLIPPDRVVGAH